MRPALLVLALTLAVSGCTRAKDATKGFKGEDKRVAQAVSDLSDNATRRQADDACDKVLSTALREKLGDCAKELKKAFDEADSATLDVEDVTVTGTTATAVVSTEDRDKTVERTFKLVKEGRSWRIDSFG